MSSDSEGRADSGDSDDLPPLLQTVFERLPEEENARDSHLHGLVQGQAQEKLPSGLHSSILSQVRRSLFRERRKKIWWLQAMAPRGTGYRPPGH